MHANVGQTQVFAADHQKLGSPLRAMLTAAAVDLQGRPREEVSASMLGLHDHEIVVEGKAIIRQDGEPRGARGYLSAGRLLFHAFGAWPWAHAPDGRLPADWWSRTGYIEPLRRWHDAAVAELESEAQRARATLRSASAD